MAYEQDTGSGEGDSPVDAVTETLEERPEILVGAAFLGGFVVAQILKKVGE
jgi:hypothetical protein